jgi:GMP synthase-like glutamine amidotransferase
MEFDGQSEIPESGIKEAVMSTADHSSDHRTVIYLQRDRGIFEMTAESAGAGHTEQKTRIVKVIKSQGPPTPTFRYQSQVWGVQFHRQQRQL